MKGIFLKEKKNIKMNINHITPFSKPTTLSLIAKSCGLKQCYADTLELRIRKKYRFNKENCEEII